MPSESTKFVLLLDGGPVLDELKKIREGIGALEAPVKESVEHIEKHTGVVTEFAESIHKHTRQASGALLAMQGVLGDTANESSVMVREASHLITAFAVGGPWATGLVAVGAGLAYVREELSKGAKESKNYYDAVNTEASKGLDELRQNARDALQAILDLGKTSAQVASDAAQQKLGDSYGREQSLQRTILNAREQAEQIKDTLAKASQGGVYGSFAEQEAAKKVNDEILKRAPMLKANEEQYERTEIAAEAELRALRESLPELQIIAASKKATLKVEEDRKNVVTTIGKLEDAQRRDDEAAKVVHKTGSIDLDVYTKRKYGVSYSEYRNALATGAETDAREQNKVETEQQKTIDEGNAEKLASLRLYWEMRRKLSEEKGQAEIEVIKKKQALENEVIQGSVSNALSAAQTLANGLATGQKDALQQATSEFLKSEGSMIVGVGTKAIFEGAAISANPLTPGLGAGMIGVGIAAVAAGIGMGAAGAALAPSTASSSSSSASSDSGVNRGSGSGGGGGSNAGSGNGVTINVVYSAGGPAPQETGRTVNRVLTAFQKSSGAGMPMVQGPTR